MKDRDPITQTLRRSPALALLWLLLVQAAVAAPEQRWSLMGSTLLDRVKGPAHVFVMSVAQNALASQGVQPGDVVLEVERDGQFFSGVAYAFLPGCNRESFEVTGSLSSDEQSIELRGRRPVRTSDCAIRSYQDDSMTLSKLALAPLPPAPPPGPAITVSPVSQTPSFDCSGRLAPDEAAICSDPALAVADRQMAAAYKQLRAQLDPAQALRLRDDQRFWLGQRQRCASDRTCLAGTIQSRITQLGNWR